jgi:hypothetical protein
LQANPSHIELHPDGPRTHAVGRSDLRRAQPTQRREQARLNSRRQLTSGADEIRVLVFLIRSDGRGYVEPGLNRSEARRVSGLPSGRRPQPTLRDPGDVAARTAGVEPREGSEDPKQCILGQVIGCVPIDRACEKLDQHRP